MVEVIDKKKMRGLKRIKEHKKNIFRRQDAPQVYDCNASIYIWKRKSLLNFKSFMNKKTVFYEMPENRSIDIDSKLDLQIVEFLLRKKNV